MDAISHLVTTLDRLVKSIPERVFGNDPGRVAAYFGLNEVETQFILQQPAAMESALSRPDFVLTHQGFKCMEVNVGSHLEGWHLSAICENYLRDESVQAFIREEGLAVGFTNTTRQVLRHFIGETVRRPYFKGHEVNLGIPVPPEGSGYDGYFSERYLSAQYAAALEEVQPGLQGQCVVCHSSDLEVAGSMVRARGLRLHAVYEQTPFPPEVFRALFRCAMAKGVELYSGLCTMLLSDKRTLALLSGCDGPDVFSGEERDFIEHHVPATRLLREGSTVFRGQRVDLPGFVVGAKDSLVLKRGQSTKRNDVLIGRCASTHGWGVAVDHALQEGNWIVQDYLECPPFYYQAGLEGYTLHNLVFATFVVGGRHAGSWLRMMPTETKGPINRSYGADIGLSLEIDE